MNHWIKLLKEHGLNEVELDSQNPLIRKGDPTQNRMMGFSFAK